MAAVSPDRVVEVQEALATRRREDAVREPMSFGPVIDGDIVTTAPLDAVSDGATAGIPVMLGATAEEVNATVLRSANPIDDARVERRLARMGLSTEQITEYRATFPGDTEPWQVLGQATTDSMFRAPALRFADARAEAEAAGGTTGDAGTWAYEFQWRSPALCGVGAVHCLDVPFAFDVLDADGAPAVTGEDAPQELADVVHGAWVRFVTDGDPGWPRYETASRSVMAYDTTSKVVDDPWHALRTIWPRP
jgi:para-nitrobenzyl esterase